MTDPRLQKNIASDMNALQHQMQTLEKDWARLKNTDAQFQFSRQINNPVDRLYQSGRENAHYLANALKFSAYDTLKQIRERLRSALDSMDTCDHAALTRAAIEANPQLITSSTEDMIRLYESQKPPIAEIEELCRILEADAPHPSSSREVSSKLPLDVVLEHARFLEGDVRVHQDADERALGGILIQGLRHAGFDADGETQIYLGHCDVTVKLEGNHYFVAECKIWRGAEALKAAFEQICRYCTPATREAAIVIYSKNKEFEKVLNAAAAATHAACSPPISVEGNGSHLTGFLRTLHGLTLPVSVVIANLYVP